MIQQPIPQPRKRRGKCALIDPEQVRAVAATGKTINDIATAFEVSATAIKGICADYGIPLIAKAGRHPGKPRAAKVTAKPIPEPPKGREAELVATGGRYADLRAWAQRWGVTEVKALQEWHKLGLPIVKVGALFQANGGECTG